MSFDIRQTASCTFANQCTYGYKPPLLSNIYVSEFSKGFATTKSINCQPKLLVIDSQI